MDQRRARDRPERHQRALLVRREARLRAARASSTPSGSMSASGQCAGPRCAFQRARRANCSCSAGQVSQKSSLIRHMFAWRFTCSAADSARLARREAQHHRPARCDRWRGGWLRSRASCVVVRPADVVHLHEVDAPGREQLEHGIVVGLRARLRHVDAVHVGVPRADARGVRDVGGAHATCPSPAGCAPPPAAGCRASGGCRTSGPGVDVVGERLEAAAAAADGKRFGRGQEAALLVHRRARASCRYACPLRAGLVPLDVDGEDVQPKGSRFAAMKSACALTCVLGDRGAEASQLFQPMGGAGAQARKRSAAGHGPR